MVFAYTILRFNKLKSRRKTFFFTIKLIKLICNDYFGTRLPNFLYHAFTWDSHTRSKTVGKLYEDCDSNLCGFIMNVWNVKYWWAHLKDCCPFNGSIETVQTGCYSHHQSAFNLLSVPYASMWCRRNGIWAFCGPRDASPVRFVHPLAPVHKRHNFPFFHLPLNVLHPALSRYIHMQKDSHLTHTDMYATFYIHHTECNKHIVYKLNGRLNFYYVIASACVLPPCVFNCPTCTHKHLTSHCESAFQEYSLFGINIATFSNIVS